MATSRVGVEGTQASFPGEDWAGLRPRLVKPRARPLPAHPEADWIEQFVARVGRRSSGATTRHYRWVIRDILRVAERRAGRSLQFAELLSDRGLVGETLADLRCGGSERLVSGWLFAQRRSVLRRFCSLMASELEAAGVVSPLTVVDAALRQVAEPVGSGFRLTQAPIRNKGGAVPSPAQIEAVRRRLAEGSVGWIGQRNVALFEIMELRGQRVGALLALDGANLFRLRSGAGRAVLRAKSSRDPAEIAIPVEVVAMLSGYFTGFNQWAAGHGLAARVGFGRPGPVWRTETGRALGYAGWARTLRRACDRACVPRFTSHALRRAFATEAVKAVPRQIAALAGNWTSPRRMDDHYVRPDLGQIEAQLAAIRGPTTLPPAMPAIPIRGGPDAGTVVPVRT